MIVIGYLCDYPEYRENVSRWLYDEFVHREDDDLKYETFHSNFLDNNKTKLPIRLVAIMDGKCVGTVTIIDNDFYGKSYSPWLGGLYVDTPYRNEGIGQRMIDFIKQIAKDLDYYEIYLNTENAGGYYKRLGWIYIETCLNEGSRICEIYKYEL